MGARKSGPQAGGQFPRQGGPRRRSQPHRPPEAAGLRRDHRGCRDERKDDGHEPARRCARSVWENSRMQPHRRQSRLRRGERVVARPHRRLGRVRERRAVAGQDHAPIAARFRRSAEPVPRPVGSCRRNRPRPTTNNRSPGIVARHGARLQCRRPVLPGHRRPFGEQVQALRHFRRLGTPPEQGGRFRPVPGMRRRARLRLAPVRTAGIVPLPPMWIRANRADVSGPRRTNRQTGDFVRRAASRHDRRASGIAARGRVHGLQPSGDLRRRRLLQHSVRIRRTRGSCVRP